MSWGRMMNVHPLVMILSAVLTFIGIQALTNPDLDLLTKVFLFSFCLILTLLALLFESMIKARELKNLSET